MKPTDDIRHYFRDATLSANPEIHERVFADVLRAHQQTPAEGSKQNVIVKSPLREQESSWNTRPALHEATAKKRTIRITTRRILIAALIGAGVVTAAAALGVKYEYHFTRIDEGGRQVVEREDGLKSWHLSPQTAANPGQAVQTARELDLLGQQGRREPVIVGEWEVDGQLDRRSLTYEYLLPDGRTIRAGEPDPNDSARRTLTGERLTEAVRLARQAVASTRSVGQFQATDKEIVRLPPKETQVPTYERIIQGRTFVFEKYTFTLSDGTPVSYSHGVLKGSQ
jgi:hypothetical protein